MFYLADFETPKNSREYLKNKKTYDTSKRAEKYLNSDRPVKEASRIWKLKGFPSRFAEEGEGSMGAYVDLQNKIKKRVEQIKPEVFRQNKESFKDNYQWRLDKKVTKKHAKRAKAKTAKTFNVTRKARKIADEKLTNGLSISISSFSSLISNLILLTKLINFIMRTNI